jgi:flagellar motor switch protein FliG
MTDATIEINNAENRQPTPRLDGCDAAAILLLLLDEGDAAAIIQTFQPNDIQAVGRAMFVAANADEGQIETALDRFISAARDLPSLATRASPHIQNVLSTALGDDKAKSVIEGIAPHCAEPSLEALRWMDAKEIGQILAKEHLQVGAVILASLEPDIAAEALAGLPAEQQAELMIRAAGLGVVRTEALADIEAVLAQDRRRPKRTKRTAIGGKSKTARIINKLKKDDGIRILNDVKRRDKRIGQEIEDEMFVFENLLDLDDKALGTIMRTADAALLSLALKGASDQLADRILASMSARAAQTIRDEIDERGMVKRVDVESAQKAIIDTVRQLVSDGTIIIGSGSDDYV